MSCTLHGGVAPGTLGVYTARRVAASAVLGSALDAIAAATTPPEDLEGVPRYIGGIVRSPRKIKAVDPRYTGRAREACIEGSVILQAVITKAGTVRAVSVLKSLPGLTEAAVKAVRRWKFKPATLNDRPVEVYYNLTINFIAPTGCAGRISRPESPWQ
ncbi:MAG: energy transducer TonB [Acidobacteria bacterium]|nr:energy transducer TonB [Acidobacteriota bacterium]